MKRFLTLFLIFTFIAPALAEIKAPTWDEFCPEKYINAENREFTKEMYNKSLRHPVIVKISNLLLIGLPFYYLDYYCQCYLQVENNYWAKRRVAFENEINICKADSKNEALCYMQIRQLEENKTANYRLQNNMERANTIQTMNTVNSINNTIQTNNNLNNINNNLNGIRYGY